LVVCVCLETRCVPRSDVYAVRQVPQQHDDLTNTMQDIASAGRSMLLWISLQHCGQWDLVHTTWASIAGVGKGADHALRLVISMYWEMLQAQCPNDRTNAIQHQALQ